ncbi:MAG: Tol-Pal system protein TolB, partial [Alphaproteobacteria bacterium]|nr:Tol-Pal system protein TolB [Alphaproteobacteria bacterium]
MAAFRVFLTVVIAFGAVWAGALPSARAQLEVDITKFNVEPIPIAIPTFEATTQVPEMASQTQETAANLARVVIADLERSGLFRALPADSFIEQDPSPNRRPRFGDWRAINAQGLVVGQVEFLRDGRLQITFRLWDVFAQSQMAGVRFQTTPGNWRQIAHRIADAIYERLTGEQGYFDTRIVYIAEEGIATERRERLAVMDQDGANHEYLTDGDFLVLSPRFSPSAQEITFMSYE